MRILAVDTATKSCSAALLEDETLRMEITCNLGLTHSQTAMEQVAHLLGCSGCTVQQLDLLAVTVGPGSFTGLRIGISGVKGLCLEKDVPCAPVSTLEALAAGADLRSDTQMACQSNEKAPLLVSVLDARQNRVFGAAFEPGVPLPKRLSPDATYPVAEWIEQLRANYPDNVYCFLGDGASLCLQAAKEAGCLACALPRRLWLPSSYAVGRIGHAMALLGNTCTPGNLMPVYPEQPKAQRELERRNAEKAKHECVE